MPSFNVTVTPAQGVSRTRVQIDDVDVTNPNVNPISLTTGTHVLQWWAMGQQGATLQISVAPVGSATPSVSEQTSISNLGMTAGNQTFNV